MSAHEEGVTENRYDSPPAKPRHFRGCWNCNTPLRPEQEKFCSNACRQKIYRMRKRLRPLLRVVAQVLEGQVTSTLHAFVLLELRSARSRVRAEKLAARLPGPGKRR